jgi:predicted DNA-binding antitoxin AbrB/MazE fold protein
MTKQQTLDATFDGKVFRPVGKVDLETGTRLEIIVIT